MNRIQAVLEFEGWQSESFSHKHGLGRIGLTGFLLGLVLGIHFCLLLVCLFIDPVALRWIGASTTTLVKWCLYMTALSGFHFGEFLNTALFKPQTVSYDSFVVNHSTAYTIAVLTSWTEFWVEVCLFGSTKFWTASFVLGVIFVALGQTCRALAMYTCGPNFDHLIMEERRSDHQLVTRGIYQHLRHPSYFGWFWWCVGTQLLLCNPLCLCAYAFAAWDFFRSRIPYEEKLLARFYPTEYPLYAARTFIGIPFIPNPALPPPLNPQRLSESMIQTADSDENGDASETALLEGRK